MTYTESSISEILKSPENFEWTIQGLGMLRTYLDPEQVTRLHIWDPERAYNEVSTVHDHPWDFSSRIISGNLQNIRFVEHEAGELYTGANLFCGIGGGLLRETEVTTQLIQQPDPVPYQSGDTYFQLAPELHISLPSSGAVTVIERKFHTNRDIARVFWQEGTWVTAEPRLATPEEVTHFTKLALEKWHTF